MRRTNTEVKEVRIRHTGTERKRAGHRTAKEGCPCPGLGSCLGWGMNEGSLGEAGRWPHSSAGWWYRRCPGSGVDSKRVMWPA